MKILYLHIGTMKTGTTSIQEFCKLNNDILKRKGYCYPEFSYKYPGKNPRRNGLFLTSIYYNKNGKRDKNKEDEIFEEGMNKIIGLFSTYSNVILSDEGMWWNVYDRHYKIWKKMLKYAKDNEFQIKIIVYFRRQDIYMESYWNQLVKSYTNIGRKNEITFEEFKEKRENYSHFDYYAVIEKIAKAVGKENIIVRRFNDAVKGTGIQADFLKTIGLELTDEFKMSDDFRHLNERLYGNTAEIKRNVNRIKSFSKEENRIFEKGLSKISELSKEEYTCSMMNEEEIKEFMKEYEEGNKKIADEFIKDGKPLFDNEYSCKQKWKKNNEYLIDDVINFSAASDIELYKLIIEQKKRIDELTYYMRHPLKGFIKRLFKK